METWIAWITRTVVFGSVIMYGAIGETLTEKAGHLNLGTPGIMCVGGAFGFAGAYAYENAAANPSVALCVLIALGCGFGAAMLAGLVYSFLTITLRANQNVCGLTLTIFGVGLAKFFGSFAIPAGAVSTKADFTYKAFHTPIFGSLSKLPVVGEALFSYGFMMYLVILIAIAATLFLNKTRTGLNLRAIGENPGTADAAGINVTKYKYVTILIGSGITGLGGVYYVLDYIQGTWASAAGDSIESLAWLAVALVIFVAWKPVRLIWGAYLFGLCFWAYNFIPTLFNIKVNVYLTQMLPYVVTILVLIIASVRQKRENQGPASLGLSYFREER